MEIVFCTEKLRKLCNSAADLQRKCGLQNAKRIQQRLSDLRAAASLADLSHIPPMRCHALIGDRAGQFAVDIDRTYRIVFEPADDPIPCMPDGGIDRKRITIIRILDVNVDYHD